MNKAELGMATVTSGGGSPPQPVPALLLTEDGDFLLTEDGLPIQLE